MLPIVLGIVCGPLTAALLAFCLLPLFDLARHNRAGWRAGLVITGVIVAGIVYDAFTYGGSDSAWW